jgi:TonB family protein
MWTWSSSEWFSLLLGIALKSTVVLGVAWCISLVLRRRSAAARHLVWTAATAAVLALPLLSIALPAFRLPISNTLAMANSNLLFQAFVSATSDAPEVSTTRTTAGTAERQSIAPRTNVKLWVVLIWSGGVVLSLLQMLLAWGSMWRTRRAARLLADEGVAAHLAQSLEIPHQVPVFETAAGGMPMTFGFLRPAVFLPADSADWSEERRRIVLLHELAHVRRGDAATHLMARTALSLNWWNPLAWFTWREFLKERERATDDLVLSAGARASEYATHLLEVARSMNVSGLSSSAAVAMARRSELEGRLMAILDSRLDRKPIRSAATPAIAAIAAAMLIAPFAAVRAQQPIVAPEVDATIRAANSQKNHEILEHAASVYENLHRYDTAQTLLESALKIRGEVAGQQSADYAAGLVKLGDLALKRNHPDDALEYFSRALALGDKPETARAMVYLGMRAYGKRDYEKAMDLLQRAVNVAPAGPQAGPAYTFMAAVRDAQSGAHASLEGPGTTSDTGGVRFRTSTATDRLAGLLADPQKATEVEPLLQRALAVEAPDSLDTAVTLELYARFLREHDRGDEAKPMAERAAEIRRNKLAMNSVNTPGDVFRVGGGVTAPLVLSKRDPEYTEVARAAKYQGTVLLAVEIGPDGLARNIRVVRSLGLGLDEKAIEAVQQWQFKPGTKDGQPVTVAASIEVNFKLM